MNQLEFKYMWCAGVSRYLAHCVKFPGIFGVGPRKGDALHDLRSREREMQQVHEVTFSKLDGKTIARVGDFAGVGPDQITALIDLICRNDKREVRFKVRASDWECSIGEIFTTGETALEAYNNATKLAALCGNCPDGVTFNHDVNSGSWTAVRKDCPGIGVGCGSTPDIAYKYWRERWVHWLLSQISFCLHQGQVDTALIAEWDRFRKEYDANGH